MHNVIKAAAVTGRQGEPAPDVSLRATLSADGRTLTGVFGTVPVTLTR